MKFMNIIIPKQAPRHLNHIGLGDGVEQRGQGSIANFYVDIFVNVHAHHPVGGCHDVLRLSGLQGGMLGF